MSGLSDKKRSQLLKDLGPALVDGEQVIEVATGTAKVHRMGNMQTRQCTLAVTDRRVLIFSKKFGGYEVMDFAYGLLSGIDYKKGRMYGNIELRAAGEQAHVRNISTDQVIQIAGVIRDRMAVSHSPAGSPSISVADELAKLAQMRDAGILTEPEFNAQKAKLLN